MHLALLVKSNLVSIFFELLGHGFSVNVRTGCSVKEILCSQLGIHEDYLAERIQTIFLNAKVVDDVNTVNVPENSVLALSGAMPGLVGAILRSGGFYAPMRSQISYDKDISSAVSGTGRITLKLLNLIVKELGPTFLKRGIYIQTEEMLKFIERHAVILETGCIGSELDGKSFAIGRPQQIQSPREWVLLQVSSEQAD